MASWCSSYHYFPASLNKAWAHLPRLNFCLMRAHCKKKWSFPLKISSVNVTKWSHLLKKPLMENFIFCAVCLTPFASKNNSSSSSSELFHTRQFKLLWKNTCGLLIPLAFSSVAIGHLIIFAAFAPVKILKWVVLTFKSHF